MQIKAIMNLAGMKHHLDMFAASCGLNIDWGEFVAHARTYRLLGLHAMIIILPRSKIGQDRFKTLKLN